MIMTSKRRRWREISFTFPVALTLIYMFFSIKESAHKNVLNNNQCDELKVRQGAQEISKLTELDLTLMPSIHSIEASLVYLFLDFSIP